MTGKTEISNLQNIALCIAENSNSLSPSPITGFMAMVGNQYKNDLMVVGRAVGKFRGHLT